MTMGKDFNFHKKTLQIAVNFNKTNVRLLQTVEKQTYVCCQRSKNKRTFAANGWKTNVRLLQTVEKQTYICCKGLKNKRMFAAKIS